MSSTHSDCGVESAFQLYCAMNADKAVTSLAHDARCIALFTEFLAGQNHSGLMRDVTRGDAMRFRAWLIGLKKYKPSSINSFMRGAAALFAWAARDWDGEPMIPRNPFSGVPKVDERIKIKTFRGDEVKAMMEAADPFWRGLIVLGVGSGMSRGECLNATWADLDTKSLMVFIRDKDDADDTWAWTAKRRGQSVSRGDRELPLSPTMREVLKELKPLTGKQPYPFIPPRRYEALRSRIGTLDRRVRNCPVAGFDGLFVRLCKAAGIRRAGRKFHDLRKTAITHWANDPENTPKDLLELSRHSTWATLMRYYLAVSPDVAARARKRAFI